MCLYSRVFLCSLRSMWNKTDFLKTVDIHDEGVMWTKGSLCNTGVLLLFDSLSIIRYKSVFDSGNLERFLKWIVLCSDCVPDDGH
jgi:hypothetical protein